MKAAPLILAVLLCICQFIKASPMQSTVEMGTVFSFHLRPSLFFTDPIYVTKSSYSMIKPFHAAIQKALDNLDELNKRCIFVTDTRGTFFEGDYSMVASVKSLTVSCASESECQIEIHKTKKDIVIGSAEFLFHQNILTIDDDLVYQTRSSVFQVMSYVTSIQKALRENVELNQRCQFYSGIKGGTFFLCKSNMKTSIKSLTVSCPSESECQIQIHKTHEHMVIGSGVFTFKPRTSLLFRVDVYESRTPDSTLMPYFSAIKEALVDKVELKEHCSLTLDLYKIYFECKKHTTKSIKSLRVSCASESQCRIFIGSDFKFPLMNHDTEKGIVHIKAEKPFGHISPYVKAIKDALARNHELKSCALTSDKDKGLFFTCSSSLISRIRGIKVECSMESSCQIHGIAFWNVID